MRGVFYWSFSSIGRLASPWRKWWMKSQQPKWHLRVISPSMFYVKNEPAQGCHLPRDPLHVQFIGMAENNVDRSADIEFLHSSESDTEQVSKHYSDYVSPQFSAASPEVSPMLNTPEFATASPESCPLFDTPVFSSSSPGSCPELDVSAVTTTPSQEVESTFGTSRGHWVEVREISSSVASLRDSRSCSPATTISYEDDFFTVVLPLCQNTSAPSVNSRHTRKRTTRTTAGPRVATSNSTSGAETE